MTAVPVFPGEMKEARTPAEGNPCGTLAAETGKAEGAAPLAAPLTGGQTVDTRYNKACAYRNSL